MSNTSLLSALRQKKKKMMKADDKTDQLPLGSEDPLLRMDPSSKTRTAAAALEDAGIRLPTANKRLKLTRASSTASSASATKKSPPKTPLLHQSCRLFAKCAAVIEGAVEMEPQALTIRADHARPGNNSSFLVGDVRLPYSLPINILIHQDASIDVLKLVASAAPEALTMKDGREDGCSLVIALRLHGRSSRQTEEDEGRHTSTIAPPTIPEEVLNANTAAAQIPDRRRNFPLHVAAYVGSSFDVINKLYYAYPEALMESNFHGETPLDICIRNGKCSDLSTSFLQDKMDHLKTAKLRAQRK